MCKRLACFIFLCLVLAATGWAIDIKINFQSEGAEIPAGYLPDYGELYATKEAGVGYGWLTNHTDVARDRGINYDQRIDTLIHLHTNATWELALPNGQYTVTVSIGDAGFSSIYTLNAEGINCFNNIPLSTGQFVSKTVIVAINDGRLTIENGAALEKSTRLNYIEVKSLTSTQPPVTSTPAYSQVKINFQPQGVNIPKDFMPDYGEIYRDRGNGYSYGWLKDQTNVTRDRNLLTDQRLDTIIHMGTGSVWELALPNGQYNIRTVIGDPGFTSLYTFNVEGINICTNKVLEANEYCDSMTQVYIFDGKLTLDNGKAPDKATRICFLEIISSTPTPTPTTTVAPTRSPLGQNVGDVWFESPTKTVNAGDEFTTKVYVNTGTQKIAAYTFDIRYNINFIRKNYSKGYEGVDPGSDGFITIMGSSYPERIFLSSFDVSGKGPNTRLHLLTIHWIALSTGTTTVSNNVTCLSDETTATIGIPWGGSMQIVVNSVIAPTPTPIPTVEAMTFF